jgi:ATP-dependent helicase/nuclease subunit B
MGITVITGRQSQLLSQRVYYQIGMALKFGKEKLYLLVPEQFTLGAEEALIKANLLPGLFNVEVLSPKRLGTRVLQETGGLTKIFVDVHGKNMLLQKTLGDLQNDLTIYGSSVRKTGFLQNISDLISELKQNDVTPAVLLNSRKELNHGIIAQKMDDIIAIYEHFNNQLGSDHKDEEDLRNLICDKIPFAGFLKNSEIWIDGFQNFSALDYKMIRSLVETAAEMHFAIPWDPTPLARDHEVFQLTDRTMEAIKEIGARAQVGFNLDIVSLSEEKNPEFVHLEKNLFAFPKEKYEGAVQRIRLTQCQNTWEEVEMGAQRLLSFVRDGGLSFRDIVVLAGDLEEYGSIIKRVFTQYQIPFFMDDLLEIGDNHLVEAVVSALEAVMNNYRFDDIFGFVKTGFSPITLNECQDLENYVLEFGIRGKQWEKPFTKISKNEAINLENLNTLRMKLIDPLHELKTAVQDSTTCAEYTRGLYDFLLDIKTPERIESLIIELSGAGQNEVKEIYHQIWSILMEVFDQIVETMGGDIVSKDEYLQILKSGFQGYRLGIIPPYRDYVSITDLRRSRSSSFEALIIFGLNEGKIPGAGTEPNLFSDQERQILGSHQIKLQNNRSFQMEQERFLVYDLLTRPESELSIFWSLADMEGSSLQPSILLSQFIETFPEIEIQSTINQGVQGVWNKIGTPEGTLNHLVAYLRNHRNGRKDVGMNSDEEDREIHKLWEVVMDWYRQHPKYQNEYDKLIVALNYTGIAPEMTEAEASRLYGKNLRSSITRLEKYRQCPFSHYVRYGLKPEPRPIYTIEAPEIGTLLHELVDGFFKKIKEEQLEIRNLPKIQRDQIVEDLMAACLPQIKTNVFNSSGQNRYLGKKLERVGKKSIEMLVQHLMAGDFEPAETELCFENEVMIPDSELGQIKIYGKIDRLDIFEKDGNTWIKIVDYKTGSRKLAYDDIYYGLSLQLLVYLDGAMTVIKTEEVIPGGTFYFYLDDPIPRVEFGENIQSAINKSFKLNGLLLDDTDVIAAMDHNSDGKNSEIITTSRSEFKLTQAQFEDIINYVRKIVIREVRSIYQGDIRIRPFKKGTSNACQFCDYKGICQFDDEIIQAGYEVLMSSLKKDTFFQLIKGGGTDAVDQ